MTYKDTKEFEEKTGYPAKAAKSELVRIGGRYFCSDPVKNHKVFYHELIHIDSGGRVYTWKRVAENKASDSSEFEIHSVYGKLEQISFSQPI